MLNLIEDGKAWPSATLHVGAHLLCKDEDNATSALAYRILLITPALYRLWARLRLKQLAPWIDTWATAAMFAGRKGGSADEGWYLTSLDVEEATITGN